MNGLTDRLRLRGLKPVEVLAANRQHGDRLRYLAGCKCSECKRANTRYESMRQRARRNGDWNGIVSAAKARRRLLSLSRRGIGRRAVSIASDVPEVIISEIRSKKKLKIRARTERRIMAVTTAMASDHALVPARLTWKLLRQLIEEWYTKKSLAELLGYQSPAIQFGKERITVRNAYRVERLHRQLMA